MLRFLLLTSVVLSAVFTVIGALLSREWGWSEYASDELYVVYIQGENGYFIINTDGSGENVRLAWNNSLITALDCSPDGRRLAFLTNDARLHVLTYRGVDYERDILFDYRNINVANNGRVALSKHLQDDLIIDATQIFSLQVSKINAIYSSVRISSEGLALYAGDHQNNPGIHLVSLMNLDTISLTQDHFDGNEEWLAPERLFIYTHVVSLNSYQRILFDVNRRKGLLLTWNNISENIFSPDGTKLAFSYYYEDIQQVYLANAFSSHYFAGHDDYYKPLTHNDVDSTSICFLTFRPEMLIDQS